jgi:tRNA G46 methylase TrmB
LLDGSRQLDDDLVLRTAGGAVPHLSGDLARLEPRPYVVARDADSVRIRYRGPLGPLAAIRLYDVCGVALAPIEAGAMPSLEAVLARLRESLAGGLLAALATAEPVRFRVSPLRFGRWEVRDALARELGWINDPSHWDVNLEVMGSHLAAQVGALYWSRRFAKLARIPASTNPVVAALMVRLLAPEDGQLVCDPCCGAGTLLFEAAAAAPGIRMLGGDVSRPALRAARRNLGAPAPLYLGDARFLPLGRRTVHRLVCNLPFGKRVGSHRQNVDFYPGFLAEVDRVLAPQGRALALTEEKRLFRQAAGATRRLRIDRELTLSTGGLHPSVFVLHPAAD